MKRAKEGDMTAAKLVLERAIPARRSVDNEMAGKTAIQINIVGVDDGKHSESREAVADSGFKPNGKVTVCAEGGQVKAEHAGEEG